MMQPRPVCLTIGGSDTCGGAGIQADLRVFDRLGCLGCSALTALTAQHPRRIIRIEPVSLAQLEAELLAIFEYYDVAAVKTGMLVDADRIALISGMLACYHQGKPLIIDPVMQSTSGSELLDAGGREALMHALFPHATVICPNLDEAQYLLGTTQQQGNSPEALACAITMRWPNAAALLKGGHAQNPDMSTDILCLPDGGVHLFSHDRIRLSNERAHGTGCRLASAITAWIAHGSAIPEAVGRAVEFLQQDLRTDATAEQ